MGPTWGPPGADRSQVGPMWATWTLLSGALQLWKIHWWPMVSFHRGPCPDSQVHGANMGPTWVRQDPGGPHVGPMNLATSVYIWRQFEKPLSTRRFVTQKFWLCSSHVIINTLWISVSHLWQVITPGTVFDISGWWMTLCGVEQGWGRSSGGRSWECYTSTLSLLPCHCNLLANRVTADGI